MKENNTNNLEESSAKSIPRTIFRVAVLSNRNILHPLSFGFQSLFSGGGVCSVVANQRLVISSVLLCAIHQTCPFTKQNNHWCSNSRVDTNIIEQLLSLHIFYWYLQWFNLTSSTKRVDCTPASILTSTSSANFSIADNPIMRQSVSFVHRMTLLPHGLLDKWQNILLSAFSLI